MNLAIFFYSRLYGYEVHVIPQWKTGHYRADFLVLMEPASHDAFDECRYCKDGKAYKPVGVVVECDGHDFHEKTKEQASRDKKRDREIQLAGHSVLHFTGSDIWRDPIGCAKEVIVFLQKKSLKAVEP